MAKSKPDVCFQVYVHNAFISADSLEKYFKRIIVSVYIIEWMILELWTLLINDGKYN